MDITSVLWAMAGSSWLQQACIPQEMLTGELAFGTGGLARVPQRAHGLGRALARAWPSGDGW